MANESTSNSGVNTVAVVVIFALVVLIGGWFLMRGGLGTGAPASPGNQAPAPSLNGGQSAPGGNPPPVNPPGGDNPAPPPPSNP